MSFRKALQLKMLKRGNLVYISENNVIGEIMRRLIILLLIGFSACNTFADLIGDFAPFKNDAQWTYLVKTIRGSFGSTVMSDSIFAKVRLVNIHKSDSGEILTLHYTLTGLSWSGSKEETVFSKVDTSYIVTFTYGKFIMLPVNPFASTHFMHDTITADANAKYNFFDSTVVNRKTRIMKVDGGFYEGIQLYASEIGLVKSDSKWVRLSVDFEERIILTEFKEPSSPINILSRLRNSMRSNQVGSILNFESNNLLFKTKAGKYFEVNGRF